MLANRPLERTLRHAYVALMLAPERKDGSRTVALARYGALEVRLLEFDHDERCDASFWLELYCHDTRSSLDSCRCDDLDDADAIADSLLLRAQESQGFGVGSGPGLTALGGGEDRLPA